MKFNRTIDKLIHLLNLNNSEEFAKEMDEICNHYDLLKDGQWASAFESSKTKVINNPLLPVPRLEIRWRENTYKSSFGSEGFVCDLGLVSRNGEDIVFNVFSSTMASQKEDPRESLYIPWRKESDVHSLMYQLNLKAFISYQEVYDEIKFPTSKSRLSGNVLNIMKKEDIDKLS